MEKHVWLGLLLDCYGGLLTERQRSLLSQSVNEDCSLAEIAEREGISRQGVRDAINRATEQLEEYENILSMISRRRLIMNELEALRENINNINKADLERLTEIIQDGI